MSSGTGIGLPAIRRGAMRAARAAGCLACCLAVFGTLAQVITDGTLGARVNLPGPNFTVIPSLGRISGANLFHSFSTLTIRSGQSVNFLADGTLQNVIARVTGGQPSGIDGQIRSSAANVNIFLLNPAGVLFGPNASLNVAASFYASTADYLRFADGSRFNTLAFGGIDEQIPASSPSAFGFLERATNIQLTGAQLRVNEGRSIGLIGGNLGLTNQGSRVTVVSAPSGSVAAVASGGASEVLLSGRFQAGAPTGRLEILGGSVVSVNEGTSNLGSGRLVIRGGDVFIDHSRVLAQTKNGNGGEIDIGATSLLSLKAADLNGATTGRGNAARIVLAATDIVMEDSSSIDTSCEAGCSGRGGDIDISAMRSVVTRSSAADAPLFIASNTFGSGATGKVSVTTPLLAMSGNSSLQAITVGAGNSNGVTVNVGSLALTDGAQINTSSQGTGRGGLLVVNAADRITISGERREGVNLLPRPSGLFSNAEANGDAGAIQVNARSIDVLAGGQISSSATERSTGNAGSLTIIATGDVRVSGTATNGRESTIASNTFAPGRGGQLSISADRLMVDELGSIQTQSEQTGGAAGAIEIRVGDLLINSGGRISSDTGTPGAGGRIDISATRRVTISGTPTALTGLFSRTKSRGAGGAIAIRSPEILLKDGASITATSDGAGNAGSIEVIAGRKLSLANGSEITGQTSLSGDAGSILVQADETLEIDQSRISTTSGGSGAAGRILLKGGDLVIRNGGKVTSDTNKDGAGGSIDIAMARGVRISGKDSGLFARTDGTADGGSIIVRSQEVHLSDGAGISVTSTEGIDQTKGTGKGGSIDIAVSGTMTLASGSFIEAASTTSGDAGNILIRAGEGINIDRSRISSSARFADGGNIGVSTDGKLILTGGSIATEVGTGLGNGGNVSVIGGLMLLRNSAISANAFGGDGGNIQIASTNVLSDTVSRVTASSQLGIDGTVQFESPAADLSGALFSVNSTFLDANAVLAARCLMPQLRSRTRLALRTFDPDHRDESGYLFPQAVDAMSRIASLGLPAER